jgi:hypothetical protein
MVLIRLRAIFSIILQALNPASQSVFMVKYFGSSGSVESYGDGLVKPASNDYPKCPTTTGFNSTQTN